MYRLLALLMVWSSVAGPPSAHAQSAYDLFGSARTSALGYASTALTEASGLQANPATHARRSYSSVSFFARESFGLSALRYGAVFGAWPSKWGVVSGGASTFGGEGYRELHYTLGIARAFQFGTSRHVRLGIAGRYYHTRIDGFGSSGALGLHVGIVLPLLPSLHLGAHATNLNGPSLADGVALPQTLSVGVQYRVSRRLLVVTDIFKDLSFPASVRAGVEILPLSVLAIRAGVTTAPTRFTGGIGILLNWVRVQLAAEQHSDLGWSPSASLEVRW